MARRPPHAPLAPEPRRPDAGAALATTILALLAAPTAGAVLEVLAEAVRATGPVTVVHAETSGSGAAAFAPGLTRLRWRGPVDPRSRSDALLRAAAAGWSGPLAPPAGPGLLLRPPAGAAGRLSVVALLAEPGAQEPAERAGPAFEALAAVADLRLARLAEAPPPALRPRQREVLAWAAAGRTTAQTAVILGLTPAAVEKHLRLAREALRAETTPQAVARAVRFNLIESIG